MSALNIVSRTLGSNLPASSSLFNTASIQATRAFATKKPLHKAVRIEEKLGVGLRYRKPRTWDGTKRTQKHYESSEIKGWREKFGMPKMQHSLSKVSYSDEEIMEWRTQFDKYAGSTDLIAFASFQDFIKSKYESRIEAKELPSKVMEVWNQFDEDKNNFIDFGEFCKASFKFDFLRLKEDLKSLGVGDVMEKYKDEDGYITEEGIFEMMKVSDFTLATTSDMRKILKLMDKDKDGMVSDQDLDAFLGNAKDFSA